METAFRHLLLFTAALALFACALSSAAPRESPAAPSARAATDLPWWEKLQRDLGLTPSQRYWEGVVRLSEVELGGRGPTSILEVAEHGPGELLVRRIAATGDYERGWVIASDGTQTRPGNFEELSRAVIRLATAGDDLVRTMKDPRSMVVCPHPQWIRVEVESRGNLPLSVARNASCESADPMPQMRATIEALLHVAGKR